MVVSRELIRVAILWHELWHEALDEASRLFFSEKNAPGMIQALEPLHEMIEAVRSLIWKFSFLFISFVIHRAQLLLERPLLIKCSAENFTRHVKVVVVIERMGTQVGWIRLGISITV
jgi:FKBP12-rapamycin binding domain